MRILKLFFRNLFMKLRTSLVIQWLRLCTFTAGKVGLIPGQGTKIPYAMQHMGSYYGIILKLKKKFCF